MRGLKDKVLIVTGAGRGIGRATAERLASEGAKVVVAEFDTETGSAAAAAIKDSGGQAMFVEVNVADGESVKAMIQKTREAWDRIDGIINNAGIVMDGTLKKMSDEQFDRVIEVNLKGTFLCTREVAKVLIEQDNGGVILNAASVVALYGNFGQTNYVASKAGVIGMTKTWARELGRSKIRVNAIAPGFIDTAMTQGIPEKVMDKLKAKIPLNCLGAPEDIAAAYAFLASDDGRYITGTVLSVDGGAVL